MEFSHKLDMAGADLSFQVCAACGKLNFGPSPFSMPSTRRAFEPGQLQFITSSTYRRAPVFLSRRFCQAFADVLGAVRQEFGFKLIGWVLMPDHFHLLVQPWPAESTPRLIQQIKQRTAHHILQTLRENSGHPWSRKMLARFQLPETVHDKAGWRVWQRRYFVTTIFTRKNRLMKLNYMHANPVKHGLVDSAENWQWSSFRFYYLEDASALRMDRLD